MANDSDTTPDPLERLLRASEPILLRRALPSPEPLRAQLVAAAEAGDAKAAWFLITFAGWMGRPT